MEQLTMGDFYAVWLQCKLSLKKIENNSFAPILLNAVCNREQEILSNKSLLPSVVLDVRYKNLLSNNEKEIAIMYLVNTWKYYKKLNFDTNNELSSPSFSSCTSTDTDDIEQLLLEKDNQMLQNKTSSSSNIAAALNTFSQFTRLDKEENILKYWENHDIRELKELANITHSIPPTQVSVERLFSALKFILNDYRWRLNYDIIDDILVIVI